MGAGRHAMVQGVMLRCAYGLRDVRDEGARRHAMLLYRPRDAIIPCSSVYLSRLEQYVYIDGELQLWGGSSRKQESVAPACNDLLIDNFTEHGKKTAPKCQTWKGSLLTKIFKPL